MARPYGWAIMRVIDVLNSPWAITPAKLEEIRHVYSVHASNGKIDRATIEAAIGDRKSNELPPLYVDGKVAVVPIFGVMAKRMNMIMEFSGGCSTELVARDFKQALADPNVHAIVLRIDSPGGTVAGTQTLADLVRSARGQKPVVAFLEDCCASAAYWVASAAERVVLANGTTDVGSIGVVAAHVDVSRAEKKAGVKTTEIYAGRYKRIASNYEPLSDAGKQTIQDMVDYTYSIFVSNVAEHRGVSVDAVLQDMADGRMFSGQQAIDAGLADGMATLDDLIAELNGAKPASITQGAKHMDITIETVKAKAPEVAEAFRAEGRKEAEATFEKGREAARAEGATAERERIKSIEGLAIAGHDGLIEEMKFDGKTTCEQAAVAIIQAEQKLGAEHGKIRTAERPGAAASSIPPVVEHEGDKKAARAKLPLEERAKAEFEESAELQAEFDNVATYTAYLQATERNA